MVASSGGSVLQRSATRPPGVSRCGSTRTTAGVGSDASWSKRQPSRSLMRPAPRAAAAAAAAAPAARPRAATGRAAAAARRAAIVWVSPPIACVITAPRWNWRIAPRFWIATRRAIGWSPLPRSGTSGSPPPELLARHLDLELGLAAALVRAAQHRDVGVVPAHADLDVLPGARLAQRGVDAEPPVRRHVRLRPGVRGRRHGDAAEVPADVARGQAHVAAQRDEHVREVLADAAAAGQHLGHRAVHGGAADAVLELAAHVSAARVRKRSAVVSRILREQLRGQRGRVVAQHDVGARPQELGEVVGERLVAGERAQRRRRVRLPLGRAGERLVGARVRDDVAGRLDRRGARGGRRRRSRARRCRSSRGTRSRSRAARSGGRSRAASASRRRSAASAPR